MTTGRKRGKLSIDEEKFILTFKDKIPIEEIARQLNRTTEPVLRYITEKADSSSRVGAEEAKVNEAELRKKLKQRPYWDDIKQQFSPYELETFAMSWINFMTQFRENVLWSEEIEIKQWITLDILMARSMRERYRHMEEINKLTKLIDDEYLKDAGERTPLLGSWENQLTFYKGAVTAFTNDHVKLQGQIKDIKKDLKAARSDRIKQIEEGKESFVGLIKLLEDEEARERAGNEAAILSAAADKAKRYYGEHHTYLDGKISRPFLTHEIIEAEDYHVEEESRCGEVGSEEGLSQGDRGELSTE